MPDKQFVKLDSSCLVVFFCAKQCKLPLLLEKKIPSVQHKSEKSVKFQPAPVAATAPSTGGRCLRQRGTCLKPMQTVPQLVHQSPDLWLLFDFGVPSVPEFGKERKKWGGHGSHARVLQESHQQTEQTGQVSRFFLLWKMFYVVFVWNVCYREQVRINIEDENGQTEGKTLWQTICCRQNKVGDSSGCFPKFGNTKERGSARTTSFLESEVQGRWDFDSSVLTRPKTGLAVIG